jgi:hypothetical protein
LPSTRGSSAPSTIAEGLNGIASSITAAMTAPDAAPYLQLLQGLQQAVVGAIHGGQKGPPRAQQGQGGGMPQGGGMNLNQLGGQPPAGPSAGDMGGASQTGASADDIRRMMGQQAAMAQ